jgi:hypothetical protein
MFKSILTCCLTLLVGAALFAQPANDDCSMAEAITLDNAVIFSTVDATTDGPTHEGCFGVNDSIPLDVWFTWTAAETGAVRWSNCSTADFDSRIAVYAAATACEASDDNLVVCNDDGAECDNFTSETAWQAIGGQTYILRMGGFGGDTITTTGMGSVVLTQIMGGPANDFCDQAIEVMLGEAQPFNSEQAITDGPIHPGNDVCFGFGSNTVTADIWYTFTPDFSGAVEWNTCGTANFDTRLAVYNAGVSCPLGDADLYVCNDDGPGCAAFSSLLTFDVVVGETYILRLGGYADESGTGTFDLIQTTVEPPPANDDCANAEPVPVITVEAQLDGDASGFGTTVSATFEEEGFVLPTCFTQNPGGDFGTVWYSFETFGNSILSVEFFASGQGSNPATTFFVDFFSACDTQIDSMTINNSCLLTTADNVSTNAILEGLPAENTTILMRVMSRLTTDVPGEFSFSIAGEIISDVTDLSLADELEIFPNPVSDRANVRFSLAQATTVEAAVYDVTGRRVLHQNLGNLMAGSNQFTLETDQLATGVYSLRLSDGNAMEILKFVVN